MAAGDLRVALACQWGSVMLGVKEVIRGQLLGVTWFQCLGGPW